MGKRELLLIAAFVVVGVIVYQISAPPASPNDRGFSISRIVDGLRREVRGNRAHAEVTTTSTHAVDATVTDLRLRLGSGRLSILGEDRSDLHAELHVRSNGYDEAEAQQLAKQTVLKRDQAGATLIFAIDYPEPGQQTATVTLKVPSRMRVRVDQSGPAKVSNVEEVELALSRGDTTIEHVRGRVSGQHRGGGTLNLAHVGSIRLTGRNSDVRLSDVSGDVTINLQSGDLNGAGISGAIEIDANQADIKLEKLDKSRGTMRINAVAGTLTIKGLRSDARIDGRNTEIDVVIDEAAPLAIYNEGEDDIEVTPPPGGYRIDAVARDGRIVLADPLVDVTSDSNEQRATGAVKGGGPTITLRANRGDIVFRSRDTARSPETSKSER